MTKSQAMRTISSPTVQESLSNIHVGAKTFAAGLWTLPEALARRGFMLLLLWTRRDRQRRELAHLTEHQLRDVGLSRADLLAEADKPFWRA